MSHNFAALSPSDFERLCADLLSAELGESFELFSAGPDGGIDMRCNSEEKGLLIGQAKHYNNKNNLKQVVKTTEVPKVERLNPDRYFLLTSCLLNPADKDLLFNLLKPYCINTGDIWGKDDLNHRLSINPEVLRRHVKLWLQDESQLQAVLNNDLYQISNQRKSELEDELMDFAFHPFINDLQTHLENNNILLITGEAGTGKSTTCGYLGLQLAAQGYELHILRDTPSIKGAWHLLQTEKKQCFILDDFLGATFLDIKEILELESSLVSLLNKSKKSNSNLKIIIASRDYVINQAKERLPKLATWLQKNNQQLTREIKYSAIENSAKADILYNIIHFSALESSHQQEFLDNNKYWDIIYNKHFNPRLIKSLIQQNQGNINKPLMPELMKGLENPTLYWENTFQRLSREAQCFLYTLAVTSIQRVIAEEELSNAYAAIYRELHGCYPPVLSLQAAINELEPNLIVSREKYNILWFSFSNPSIQDMVQNYLAQQPGIQDAIINSMKYFSQGEYLLSSQIFNIDDTQLFLILNKMFELLNVNLKYINEWDDLLVNPLEIYQLTSLWQFYHNNQHNINKTNRKYFLEKFIEQAKQADWSQWLKKGRMKYLLEIAYTCLPEKRLPKIINLVINNISNAYDAIDFLQAYINNIEINKYLNLKTRYFIRKLEKACFNEALLAEDIDHLEQILRDIDTLYSLSALDKYLRNKIDLSSAKYHTLKKIERYYFVDIDKQDQTTEEIQDKENFMNRLNLLEKQKIYIDALFESLRIQHINICTN